MLLCVQHSGETEKRHLVATVGGEYANVDINMKRLKIGFKTTRFNDVTIRLIRLSDDNFTHGARSDLHFIHLHTA